jgi:RNA exonuclease 1
MWPLPSPFNNVACPYGASCDLPNCVFGQHPLQLPSTQAASASHTTLYDEGHATKRIKLDSAPTLQIQRVEAASDQTSETRVFTGIVGSKKASSSETATASSRTPTKPQAADGKAGDGLPYSATKPVSPPPKKFDTSVLVKPKAEERLKPRPLAKQPALDSRRLILLKALHAEMSLKNSPLARAVDPAVKAFFLEPNELNGLAMDEEENLAREYGTVYENKIKMRVVAVKNLTVGGWLKERKSAIASAKDIPPKKAPPVRVNTGLTPKEEVIFLSIFSASRATLEAHDIVTQVHRDSELEAVRSAMASSDSWELCDRCGTRFQVFAERRLEDGALTAGGACKHHWGKRIFGRKAKRGEPSEPTRLGCCNEAVGSPGCTEHPTHVFKASDPRRLALAMPYIETPENDQVQSHAAVTFDCEMGYTTLGLEVIRLTVLSWPQYKVLVDVLVQPLGHVLDLNTRFSGVTPEAFLEAKPYDSSNSKPNRFDLRKVESPYAARDLFLSHVSPTTYVIGHAIENDLNVIRLVHPTPAVIDTMFLYPHTQGLPYRNGLKNLAKNHLDMAIQQGGAAGHDSYEDAKTTGELVRAKIAAEWSRKKADGWVITDHGVSPPPPAGLPPPSSPPHPPLSAPPAPPMADTADIGASQGSKAKKRKLEHDDESDGAGDVPPAKKA